MNANQRARSAVGIAGAAGVALFALNLTLSAQVNTQQTVTEGQATQSVTVERGEVAWVSGSNLMVRGEGGELKYFPDIPAAARVAVGGKQLGVADLKPGMKLERTTITTTTPKTIRTVRSVTGTVWQVSPPKSVILTLDNRTNQRFSIPKDQKFLVDGKETDAFGLRPGMRISASAVSDQVDSVVTTTRSTTGTAPPPPAAPPAAPAPQLAILIIEAPPVPTPVATAGALPKELPKTAGIAPLLGLIGLLSIGAAGAVRMLRS